MEMELENKTKEPLLEAPKAEPQQSVKPQMQPEPETGGYYKLIKETLANLLDTGLQAAAFWKKSSIRGQIVYSMLSITFAIEAFIFIIIIINLSVISKISLNSVEETLTSRTHFNMQHLNYAIMNYFHSELEFLENKITFLQSYAQLSLNYQEDFFNNEKLLENTHMCNEIPSEDLSYSDKIQKSYKAAISYDQMSYQLLYDASDLETEYNFKDLIDNYVKVYARWNRVFPALFSATDKDQILRLSIIFEEKVRVEKKHEKEIKFEEVPVGVAFIYPGECTINSDFFKDLHYLSAKNNNIEKNVFYGPMLDPRGTGTWIIGTCIPTTFTLPQNKTNSALMCIDINLENFMEKYKTFNYGFFQDSQILFTDYNGILLNYPDIWEINYNNSRLFDYQVQCRTGISTNSFFNQIITDIGNEDKGNLTNPDKQNFLNFSKDGGNSLCIQRSLCAVEDNKLIEKNYVSDVHFSADGNFQAKLLSLYYTTDDDAYIVLARMKTELKKQEYIIIFFIFVICALSLIAVIYFCDYVAQKISRPLRKLIEFASLINDISVGMETKTEEKLSVNEIPQGIFQVGKLIKGFQRLMGEIDIRSKSKKKAKQMDTNKDIYPFNDLNSEYLLRSGKKTFVNWDHLIKKLPENLNKE